MIFWGYETILAENRGVLALWRFSLHWKFFVCFWLIKVDFCCLQYITFEDVEKGTYFLEVTLCSTVAFDFPFAAKAIRDNITSHFSIVGRGKNFKLT